MLKANEYETDASTTEVLSDVQEAKSLLTSQSQTTNSTSGSTTPVKTNVVLKEYDVSKTDLAMYKQSGAYVQGRPDPFAEVGGDSEGDKTGSENSNSVSTSGDTTNTTSSQSDGTFYNTARQK